jgi:nucleoside-diphosphate-sugar epimerase
MNSKSLLIIGARGFFGHSIIDHIFNNYKKNNIKKILLLSRGVDKVKIDKKINKRVKIIKICADISKLKKIPFADYVIYCVINKNYIQDYKAVCNYYNLAKRYHLKSRILYTSSGAVYGQQPKIIKKIKENYLFKNKRIDFYNYNKNIYSMTKLKNEEIFKKLGKIGIKVSIARCFAFVGKHLPRDTNFVVGNFIKNILNKEKIEVKSIHNVIRSYMHEDDLVVCLFKILKRANIDCPIYNVGSDQEVNIRKLALYLSKKYKLPIKLKKIKSNFEDRYLPSIHKSKKELNLKLQYSNYRAINEVIKGLKNN